MHALPIEMVTELPAKHAASLNSYVKRILDVFLAMLLLLALLPVLAALWFALLVSSRGGFFYQQARVGRYGRVFTMYKLRSMVVGAEPNGPVLSQRGDTRITPVGAFMRRYHLDEIPQLWNVILGDMSLVGPRPERPFYVAQIMLQAPEYAHILQVRPGITGLSQLQQGYTAHVQDMLLRLQLDSKYVNSQTLWLDASILLRTIGYLLRGGERRKDIA